MNTETSDQTSPLRSVLAPSSKALVSTSFLLLLVRHLLLEAMHLFLVVSLLLVVRPGELLVTSKNAPSSDARSP